MPAPAPSAKLARACCHVHPRLLPPCTLCVHRPGPCASGGAHCAPGADGRLQLGYCRVDPLRPASAGHRCARRAQRSARPPAACLCCSLPAPDCCTRCPRAHSPHPSHLPTHPHHPPTSCPFCAARSVDPGARRGSHAAAPARRRQPVGAGAGGEQEQRSTSAGAHAAAARRRPGRRAPVRDGTAAARGCCVQRKGQRL